MKKLLATWITAAAMAVTAPPSPAQEPEPDLGPGLSLDDLDFGEDTVQMQMDDAGEGDNKEFGVVTDEDISTLAEGDVYKNNGSFFKVVAIGRKGADGGGFSVERIRGKFDPGLKWNRVSGQGPLTVQTRETLIDRFLSGGALMWPLVALLLLTLIIVARLFFYYRASGHCPPEFVKSCRKAIRRGEIDEFEDLAVKQKGLLAHSARAMAATVDEGVEVEHVEARAQGAARREVARMRFPVRLLSFIAVVAPLLGLLGTVIGMIQCFDSVAGDAADQSKAAAMASGIKQALLTTAFGLIVAVPALFFAVLFNHKLKILTTDCEVAADDLVGCIARFLKGAPAEAAGVEFETGKRRRRREEDDDAG